MIELKQISKSYEQTTALKDISLSFPDEMTAVLIGPSGCGKSTLIRIVLGLIPADRGEIRIQGQILGRENVYSLRRRIGYVIQEGGLFPHLTAWQNITLMARHLGWKKELIKSRTGELVRLTNFPAEGLSKYPAQLSGGQNQRIGVMRALMLDPDILLMDEPLGALDPLIRYDLQSDLKSIFQKLKKTVVMVTHDLGEAAYFGDRIVLLKEGKIVQKGNISELLEHPADAFVSRFVQAQRSPLESFRKGTE